MKKQVDSLVLLRAIAAFLVVLCHFGKPLKDDPIFGYLFFLFGEYGHYGVQMFFVISGFVIPLSLNRGNYALGNYGDFLLKRAYRLHPPYVLALIITLILGYFASKSKGIPFNEDTISIVQSFFYLHAPSENPVFWTLAVEAGYYFFVGLTFPIFKKSPLIAVIAIIPILVLLNISPLIEYVSFFKYSIYFLIGIFGYFIFDKENVKLNALGLIVSVAAGFYLYEAVGNIVAIATLLFIHIYSNKIAKPFHFAGEISYSVYLIHFVLGIKFINIATRYLSPSYYWALMLAAIIFVYVAGYIFYRLIEIPSAKLSNKIKYKRKVEIASAA